MDFETIGVICAALLVYAVSGGLFLAFNTPKRYALYLWGIGGMGGVLLFACWFFIHSLAFEIMLHAGFWVWAIQRLWVVRGQANQDMLRSEQAQQLPDWC